MADTITVLTIASKYGELILGSLVAGIGFLVRRSVKTLDRSIKEVENAIHGAGSSRGIKSELAITSERIDKHDQRYAKTDRQVSEITELFERLNDKINAESLKNAESFGRIQLEVNEKIGGVKGDVGECVAMLRLLVDQSKRK